MKVYCIHPGASWSTADVYTGVVAGLRSIAAIEVCEGRIDSILNWYDVAVGAGVAAGHFSEDSYRSAVLNRQRMASAHRLPQMLNLFAACPAFHVARACSSMPAQSCVRPSS